MIKIKKAQISTMDFLTAVFIFSIVLAYAISAITEAEIKALTETDYKYMIVNAIQISDYLSRNPGIPYSWDSTNVKMPGLAYDDRMISSQKVDQFCLINQNDTKDMFRIQYHLYFSLTGNRTVQCGSAPNGDKAVNIKRNVFFEGKDGVLQVTLWE
ncbi:MAG: hypothetical protein V1660_03710 [archaeon]